MDRSALVEQLRGQLQRDDVVASVDVGWVGAAHQGTVFDLAGVTDPVVARLVGGHTSKRVAPEMLLSRGVTHVLMLVSSRNTASPEEAWENCEVSRAVEVRLCWDPDVRAAFRFAGVVHSTESLRYVVVERNVGTREHGSR